MFHCSFSKEYLCELHDLGNVNEQVILSGSPLYDFCDPVQRGNWLDLFIALVEYLRSGESLVGFLNRFHSRNMLHKVFFPCIMINFRILKIWKMLRRSQMWGLGRMAVWI
jgi:hypothetical protein